MSLTESDVLKILKIIDEANFDEVRLEVGDLKLYVRREAATVDESSLSVPVTDTVSRQQPLSETQVRTGELDEKHPAESTPIKTNWVEIRAPMLGTFYRSPSPGAPPFVEEGTEVEPDDTVCLIEVMKLFNSVRAGVRGKIAKILAENGSLVESGQVLMLIEPTGNNAKESIE